MSYADVLIFCKREEFTFAFLNSFKYLPHELRIFLIQHTDLLVKMLGKEKI